MAERPRAAPGGHTPAGTVTAFAARTRLPADEIAARLRLPAATLAAYDVDGGPAWLRLALVGLALELGSPPANLRWLLRPDPPVR